MSAPDRQGVAASDAPLSVVADGLREWQRKHGGEHQYAPTTMFIDRAEQPAQAVLDALREAGYAVVVRDDLDAVLHTLRSGEDHGSAEDAANQINKTGSEAGEPRD